MNDSGVPFVDLGRAFEPIATEAREAVERVFARGNFILGEEVAAFEEEFARFLGCRYAVGVSNGTDAITIALLSSGIGEGDEVITTANTAIPTVTAIVRAGAVPVLVDTGRDYTMDVDLLDLAVTERTGAVVPVHLYGYPCDMERIQAVARASGLRIIEDCAQAHGALFDGKRAGTFGDAGCFSFYPTKNLGAFGDGGMVVTDSEEIAHRARMIRHHGQSARDVHDIPGMCARLDEIQAALLRVKLPRLEAWNAERSAVARRYRDGLAGVVLPPRDPRRTGVWHLFVIRSRDRDGLREHLALRGIQTAVHYPCPAHLQPAFAPFFSGEPSFPEAERCSGEVLSLPLFPGMRGNEVETVIDAVNAFHAS